MPLEILGPLVVFGIALTVAAVYFSGVSKTARLKSRDQAKEVFVTEHPDAEIAEIYLTSDHSAGFLLLSGGEVGLVEAMGDRYLTRHLRKDEITGIKNNGEAGLAIAFPDFTHGRGAYGFADVTEAATVHKALAALMSNTEIPTGADQ